MLEQSEITYTSTCDDLMGCNFENENDDSADTSAEQGDAMDEFLQFLEDNKDGLKTGFGAFHTNNHANW